MLLQRTSASARSAASATRCLSRLTRPRSKVLSSDAIFGMITTSPRVGAWKRIETTTFDYENLVTVVYTQVNESPNTIHGEYRINTPQMNILKIHRAKR